MNNLAVIPTFDHAVIAPDLPEKDTAVKGRFAKKRGRCRQQVLDEVVIGFFWIYLDLPSDITRVEIEALARRLIGRIRMGANEAAIAIALGIHQRSEYGRPVDADVMRKLAQRTVAAVKGC